MVLYKFKNCSVSVRNAFGKLIALIGIESVDALCLIAALTCTESVDCFG